MQRPCVPLVYWTVYSLSPVYPSALPLDADACAREHANRRRGLKLLFGIESFDQLTTLYCSFRGEHIFNKAMSYHDRYRNVQHALAMLAGTETVHRRGEHALTCLDIFAVVLFFVHRRATMEEIAFQWPQLSESYASIILNNGLVLMSLFFVPRFYGCLDADFLGQHARPDVKEFVDAFFDGDDDKPLAVLVADCTETAGVSASESLAATQRARWSTKAETRTNKLATVVATDGLIVFVSRVYGGRVPETIDLVDFLGRIDYPLLLLIDRGYMRLEAVPDSVMLGIPARQMNDADDREELTKHVDTMLSSWRAIVENVNAHFKFSSKVSGCVERRGQRRDGDVDAGDER